METKKFYGSLINTITATAFALFVLCCVGGIGNLFGATGGIFGFTLAFGNVIIVVAASVTAWRIGNAAIAISTEKEKVEKAKEMIPVEKQEVGAEALPTIPIAASEQQPKRQKAQKSAPKTKRPVQVMSTVPAEEYIPMPEPEDIPMPEDIDTGIISSPSDEDFDYYNDPAFDEIPDGIT